MLRHVLRSKIHRATVTAKRLEYAGSITIDATLLQAADMAPNECVHVLNLSNGNRFQTYIIEGASGSGRVELNGPAARLGEVGDKVIIVAYGLIDDGEVAGHEPRVVQVDDRNRRVAV